MMHARLRRLAGGGYENSVVRRTIILCSLVLPAFAANFFVYFFAARLLPADQFGLFYVALTVGNVLFSGALILNVYFTRHLVRIVKQLGEHTAIHATLRLEKVVLATGAICAVVVFAGLIAVGSYVGVQSRTVILLIVLDAFTAYVADLGRVLLQSLRRTIALGLYTLVWMLVKLALCIGGIWLFGTVWGGLAGVVASAVIMFAWFQIWILSAARGAPQSIPPLLSPLSLLPASAGYGLMIVISSLDVLTGYLLLKDADLGTYSASSVFPKSILVVITPLLQMLFPMMVTGHALDREFQLILGKIGGMVLALASGGAVVIWLLSDWLCGGTWGIKLCQPGPLRTLLVSAVPLALLRALVMLQFARARDLLMLWLAVPLAVFPYVAWMSPHTVNGLASGFAGFAAATLVFYLAISIATEVLRRRALAPS